MSGMNNQRHYPLPEKRSIWVCGCRKPHRVTYATHNAVYCVCQGQKVCIKIQDWIDEMVSLSEFLKSEGEIT